MSELLRDLNPSQQSAVTTTDGPVMILAGAGSGKTRTLVTRIVYLLNEKEISPFRILAVTFSNKAAREMRERVARSIDIHVGAVSITTFHSFCANLLRAEAAYLGLSRNFTIYDDSESKAIVKTLLERRGISSKELNPYEILNYIETLKNHGHFLGKADEVDTKDEYYSYFKEYESELSRANALDFGGLITGVINLFATHPDVLTRYQERYQYLLVDEYQDTNRAQFELMSLLAQKRKNICVVGDEDQSIYSWRGADIRNILDFEKVFPEAKLIKLEQNYRSSQNIISAATAVISKNKMRKGKSMWTENSKGELIDILEITSDREEADWVTKKIGALQSSGVSLNDVAVFYRANSQSRVIEDYLSKNRIPYRVVGGVKFYERKEIKDLLAYLRLVVNLKDSLAFGRVINVPARGVGATSLRKLEDEAVLQGVSLFEMVDAISNNPEKYPSLSLSAKVRSSLRAFSTLIHELRMLAQNRESPAAIFEKTLHESGYYEYLKTQKDYETMARLENIEELSNAIKQFETDSPNATLDSFLESVTLNQNAEESEERENGELSLMTVHGAKGLEFPYVFLIGIEENVFPSYQSIEKGEDAIEEERRLFYVAMTRAMKRLYITFAQGRMLFGTLRFNGPARFLYEIPNEFYLWKKIGQQGVTRNFERAPRNEYAQESYEDDVPVVYQSRSTPKVGTFGKGVKVRHDLYGEGLVLLHEGEGSDEKVLVQFKDGARKKFMVKFAPIVLV